MIAPEKRLPVAAIVISVTSLLLAFIISVGGWAAMDQRQSSAESTVAHWAAMVEGWDKSLRSRDESLEDIRADHQTMNVEHRAMLAEHQTMKTDISAVMAVVAPPAPQPRPAPAPEPRAEPKDAPAPAKPEQRPAPELHEKAEELASAILDRVSDRNADRQYLAGNLRGYVDNHKGEKCWYNQKPTRDESVSHFFELLAGSDSVMVFEDGQCMHGEGAYLDINLRQINNVIANWYSKTDAAFMTSMDQLRRKSGLQKQGFCVQSRTYPSQAFLVDYFLEDGSVWMVVHNLALRGCQGSPLGRV